MNQNNQDEILSKLQPKKFSNLKVYEMIERKLTETSQELFQQCSIFNLFITTKDKKKKKMKGSNSCKNRFCPICAWRKARKDAMKVAIMLEAIRLEEKKEFIFLTLTTPNIPADQVVSEINKFNKAFKKMFERKQIKGSIRGYIRKLEMTYNAERNDYNPHFHVLLAVDKRYFTNQRQYIKHEEWLKLWQEATGMPEITQVHVQKVNDTRGNAVAEIAKYSAKDHEMVHSQEVFDVFYKALKGRQLIVYGGMFKEYAKKYETGELEKYMKKDENEYFYLLFANWSSQHSRFEQEYQEMNEDQKARFNGFLQIELDLD